MNPLDENFILKNINVSFSDLLDYLNPFSDKFILKGIISNIGSILDYLNPFSSNFILKDVINDIGNILSYINPFSDNFILKDVLNYLNPFSQDFFGYKITELVKVALQDLFVPDEENINNKLNEIKGKFAFVDNIKNSANSIKELLTNVNSAPTFKVNLGETKYTEEKEVTIIDLSFYAPYKQYGDMFISAFMYLFFIWRVFVHLPNIISGVGSSANDTITIIKK